jgi:uncharacterized protein DUF6879
MTRWPAVWIASLGSALFGVVIGTLSEVAFSGSSAENLTNGLVGAAVGILFANLLERARLDSDMAVLADLRRDADLHTLVENARQARGFIHSLRNAPVHDFFADRLTELYNGSDWSELAQGQLAIPEPRELWFNRDLLRISRHRVRAIAYEDQPFWEAPEGRAFLEANREIVKAGRRLTRIFVFASPINQTDIDQMKSQASLGIEVRVLPPPYVHDDDKLDFVVYDDDAVRVAQGIGKRKRAMLYISKREVRHHIERFNNLEERSMPLADYLVTVVGQTRMTP